MKKVVLCMLVIAMIAVMAACGKTDENVPSGNTDTTKAPEVTQETEKTQDETSDNTDDKKSEDKEEPTEEPTKEAKKEPTKKPTPVPTKKPTPVPTKKPTPKPTAEPVDYDEDDDYDYAPNYSDEEATIDAIWGRWIEKGEDYPYARYLEIGRDGSFCLQNTDGSQVEGTIMIMDTYDEHNPFVYDFLTKDRTSIVMECYWDISWHSPMMELYANDQDLTFVRENEFGEYDPENLYTGTWKANDYTIKVDVEGESAFVFTVTSFVTDTTWYEWQYFANYDEKTHIFDAPGGGKCYFCTAKSGSDDKQELVYSDGKAKFVIKDNRMYWEDYKDTEKLLWSEAFKKVEEVFYVNRNTGFFTMDSSIFGCSFNEFKKRLGYDDLDKPEEWPWWGNGLSVVFVVEGRNTFACFFQKNKLVTVYWDAETEDGGDAYECAEEMYGKPTDVSTYWNGYPAYEWKLSYVRYQQHVESYEGGEGHYRQQYYSLDYVE